MTGWPTLNFAQREHRSENGVDELGRADGGHSEYQELSGNHRCFQMAGGTTSFEACASEPDVKAHSTLC